MRRAEGWEATSMPEGWALLAEAGPTGQAGFAAIVLTCLLMALRGAMPGATLAALMAAMRRRRG